MDINSMSVCVSWHDTTRYNSRGYIKNRQHSCMELYWTSLFISDIEFCYKMIVREWISELKVLIKKHLRKKWSDPIFLESFMEKKFTKAIMNMMPILRERKEWIRYEFFHQEVKMLVGFIRILQVNS